MIEYEFTKDFALFDIRYRNKDYHFIVKRNGRGFCLKRTEATEAIRKVDKNLNVKILVSALLGKVDLDAYYKLTKIEEEYLFDVKLNQTVTDAIWLGWSEAIHYEDKNGVAKITPENEIRDDAIEKELHKYLFEHHETL